MRSNEIKVGREYVVKVGGKYGFTAKETVVSVAGKIFFTRGGYGESCKRVARNFVKPVELTQERKMDLLVAFADGGFANSPVDVGSSHVSEFRIRQEYQRLHSKPTVVGYTSDGLPLTTEAVSKTLVKVCDETRGDTRLVISERVCPAHDTLCHGAHCAARETPAERVACVHAEAMARS